MELPALRLERAIRTRRFEVRRDSLVAQQKVSGVVSAEEDTSCVACLDFGDGARIRSS
jgi:hypothetical protein